MADIAHNDIDVLIWERYVPSSLERKKSIMMYVLWGVLLSLSQQKASRYEQFHLKQAIWRWTMFFILLIPAVVLAFIPWIRVLPLLVYFILIVVWVFFFMQAWKGVYTSFSQDKAFLPIFAWFGGWVLNIFDITLNADDVDMYTDEQSYVHSEDEVSEASPQSQEEINQEEINHQGTNQQ